MTILYLQFSLCKSVRVLLLMDESCKCRLQLVSLDCCQNNPQGNPQRRKTKCGTWCEKCEHACSTCTERCVSLSGFLLILVGSRWSGIPGFLPNLTVLVFNRMRCTMYVYIKSMTLCCADFCTGMTLLSCCYVCGAGYTLKNQLWENVARRSFRLVFKYKCLFVHVHVFVYNNCELNIFQAFLGAVFDTLLYTLNDSLNRVMNIHKIEQAKADSEL